jgi:hypothetical protein
MTLEGKVVNGVIVPDNGAALPEGARVIIEWNAEADDLGDIPILPSSEKHEEHLAALRESVAETKAGVPAITVPEAFARVDEAIRRVAEEIAK